MQVCFNALRLIIEEIVGHRKPEEVCECARQRVFMSDRSQYKPWRCRLNGPAFIYQRSNRKVSLTSTSRATFRCSAFPGPRSMLCHASWVKFGSTQSGELFLRRNPPRDSLNHYGKASRDDERRRHLSRWILMFSLCTGTAFGN
jgi:hypothetical protein